MIKGIGVDTVSINEIARYIKGSTNSTDYIKRTFTKDEVLAAAKSPKQSEYYAARFAAKEAVFKAIAHLLPKKSFDMRIVETLNNEDGSPYIQINRVLQQILEESNIDKLHISITTEDSYATAFVIAEKITEVASL